MIAPWFNHPGALDALRRAQAYLIESTNQENQTVSDEYIPVLHIAPFKTDPKTEHVIRPKPGEKVTVMVPETADVRDTDEYRDLRRQCDALAAENGRLTTELSRVKEANTRLSDETTRLNKELNRERASRQYNDAFLDMMTFGRGVASIPVENTYRDPAPKDTVALAYHEKRMQDWLDAHNRLGKARDKWRDRALEAEVKVTRALGALSYVITAGPALVNTVRNILKGAE